jgi:hypothetical protein
VGALPTKARHSDLVPKDRDRCLLYVEEMNRKALPAHEPWEQELVAWAENPDRLPRKSTLEKLRLRFPEET